MPTRKEIVTLDERDLSVLDEALRKEPVEKLLAEIRRTMNDGLDLVKAMRRSTTLDPGRVQAAREVLEQRIALVQLVSPGLADEALREQVLAPVRKAIALCDEITETFGERPSTAAAPMMTAV